MHTVLLFVDMKPNTHHVWNTFNLFLPENIKKHHYCQTWSSITSKKTTNESVRLLFMPDLKPVSPRQVPHMLLFNAVLWHHKFITVNSRCLSLKLKWSAAFFQRLQLKKTREKAASELQRWVKAVWCVSLLATPLSVMSQQIFAVNGWRKMSCDITDRGVAGGERWLKVLRDQCSSRFFCFLHLKPFKLWSFQVSLVSFAFTSTATVFSAP